MKHMVLLALAVALGPAPAVQADTVDDYIRAQATAQHLPGVAFAVMRDGKVIKSGGYGYASLELKAPVNTHSVFETCSVTKQFVAAGIMLLARAGRLKLDDPIGKYIDDAPPTWNDVTIRHLLTMTSGIKDYVNDALTPGGKSLDETRDFPRGDTTADQIIDSVKPLPLNFAPGEKFSYSNTGYIILVRIIAKASGKSWDRYLSERIFTPLGMADTGLDAEGPLIPGRVARYDIGNAVQNPGWSNSPYTNATFYAQGGAGIMSSAADMAKWDDALRHNTILTAQELAQMRAPYRLKGGSLSTYGFGWELDAYQGHTRMWHNGSITGGSSHFARFDDGRLTVVVLANTKARMDAIADGAFGPDIIANDLAGFFEPELAHPSFILDAQMAAAIPGKPVTVTVTATAWGKVAPDAELTIDIRRAPFGGGDVVNHQDSGTLHFAPGKTRAASFSWTPQEPGEYRVYVGAFSKDYKQLYMWKNAATSVTVR